MWVWTGAVWSRGVHSNHVVLAWRPHPLVCDSDPASCMILAAAMCFVYICVSVCVCAGEESRWEVVDSILRDRI